MISRSYLPIIFAIVTGTVLTVSGQSVQVDPVENAEIGKSVTLNISLLEEITPSFSLIGFRPGGQRKYTVRSLVPDGDRFKGVIPAEFITDRGVEYYVSFSDSSVTYMYPPEDSFPESNPAAIRINANQYTPPLLSLERNTHKMISVPMELENPDVLSVLEDDYGSYDTEVWRLFYWRNDNAGYVEYPAMDIQFTRGKAFWLITAGGNSFDVDNAITLSSNEAFTGNLSPGWNQVGDPFAFAVAWDSVRFEGAGVNEIKGPYYFDGTEYIMDDRMRPWEGCFILNESDNNVTMTVPPKEITAANPGKTNAFINVDPATDYQLQISGEISGARYRDTQNFIGWARGAEAGDDQFDFPEAPPVGQHLRLSVLKNGKRFMSNFEPLPPVSALRERGSENGTGYQWQIEVSAPAPRARVQMHLHQTGSLPGGFQLYILDEDNFNAVPVENNTFVIEVPDRKERHLRILLGTAEFATKHSNGIPLIPQEYSLKQNYPNPFNPKTTIEYQLRQNSSVVLEVFNILGQKVRTLIKTRQNTGQHLVEWDGLNDSGRPAASGIYVYRLQARSLLDERDEFIAIRKMSLIR